MSADAAGNVYAVDLSNSRVMKWAPGASVGVLVAGGNGVGNAINSLDNPTGLFVDPNTYAVWIADKNNNRIVKWSSSAQVMAVYGNGSGSGANQFRNPSGVFVDTSASNTMYVADSANNRIQLWSAGAGSGVTVAGHTGFPGSGLNQLNFPVAVIVDTNGYIYISDSNNYRVMRWAAGSNYGVPIAGNVLLNGIWLSRPGYSTFGISLDPSGGLLVADLSSNRVVKYALSCRKLL